MGEPESHIHPVGIRNQRDVGVRTVETREDRLRIERNLLAVEPNLRFTRFLSDFGKVPRPVEWFSTTVDTVGQNSRCVAGLFPDDWKPLWAKTDADAVSWYCRNKPRFLLVIPPVRPPKLQERARPAANDDSIGYMDRFQVIEERQWYGVYEADDLEAKRWLQRMIRVVKKGMTNRCCYISYLTGYPVHRCDKGSSTWFAPGDQRLHRMVRR